MNVLLVIPRFVNETGKFYQFPLGIAYIASAVENMKIHNVYGLDLNYCSEESQQGAIIKSIDFNKIDVVMSGGLSPFIVSLRKIFRTTKKVRSDILTVVGGGVVSGDPVEAHRMLEADISVIGEGEETIVEILNEFCSNKNYENINGIAYLDKYNNVIKTPARNAIRDIDSISWPNFDIFDINKNIDRQSPLDHHFFQNNIDNNPRSIDIITSRSCPFMCTFCFHPVGKKYRERNVDDVISEIRYYIKKYNINMISILDELFSLRRDRLLEFCKKIRPLNLQWMIQLHVRSASFEVLNALKSAGCVYISYGIESANDEVLGSMQKKTTVTEINKALKVTVDNRVGIQGNLIVGDTKETIYSANESMKWWANNRKYSIYLSQLQVFPGSPDYVMAVRDGLIKDRKKFIEKLPVNLNISNINNIDLSAIKFQLKVHGRTLLNLVRSSFKRNDGFIDIEFTCPYCHNENIYSGVELRSEHRHFIRIFCRDCHARVDIINMEYDNNGVLHKESNPALLGGGSLFDYKKISIANNADSDCLDQSSVLSDKHPNKDVYIKGRDLLSDPFSLIKHVEFADVLMLIGATSSALLHYKQAMRIVEYYGYDNLTSKEVYLIKRLKKILDNVQDEGEKYFISYSDELPPFRKSRDGKGYVNKYEPDFPDFDNIQVTR